MRHEYKFSSRFLLHQFTQKFFFLRFKIFIVLRFTMIFFCNELLCFQKFYFGYRFNHRQFHLKQFQFCRIMFFQAAHYILQHFCLRLHNFFKAFDITHFKVHAGVFVQMSCCIMFFSPKHRGNLKYSFKYSNHHLLIKLRTLRQICFLPKIIQLKNICTSFRSCIHNLWCMNFCKVFMHQKFSHSTGNAFLNFKNCTLFLITQGNRSEIKQILYRSVYQLIINDNW